MGRRRPVVVEVQCPVWGRTCVEIDYHFRGRGGRDMVMVSSGSYTRGLPASAVIGPCPHGCGPMRADGGLTGGVRRPGRRGLA